ncbi:VPS10 domain-containing receptor SorCS1 [Thelohanellus kitauei]|uniref:VPS10 domain-containing receptor SorCS1 n=1 Tax=Thelohanellus kitauei TaxID=669202 RepID=A0A0C2MFL1_THEKT|nr:VPS10 domain-containing receptor SorCS1 [Thelohanellus kitauei]
MKSLQFILILFVNLQHFVLLVSAYNEDYTYDVPPPELVPRIIYNKLSLQDLQHQVMSNDGLILILKNFNKKNISATESFFYVSNDYGLTFSRFTPMVDEKPVFVKTKTLYISSDYGQNFDKITEGVESIKFFTDKPLIFIIHDNDMMQVRDMSNNNAIIFQIHAIQGRILYAPSSLIINFMNVKNVFYGLAKYEWNLMIYDFETRQSVAVVLPTLFHLKTLDQYDDLHGHYYIVATDLLENRCLFTSYDKGSYFVTVMCDLSKKTLNTCPVLIHPFLPGVIYANVRPELKLFHTYYSKNDGKMFGKMKIDYQNRACVNGLGDGQFHLPCVYKPYQFFMKEWIISLAGYYGHYQTDQIHFFITFNAGKIWKLVPFSNFPVRIMNEGGIILGLNQSTNKLIYSFDEGNTYYGLSIFDEDQFVIEVAIIGTAEKERAIFYGHDANRSTLLIAHVDFTKILKRTCIMEDYSPWILTRYHGSCYQGQEIIYLKKNMNSTCIDNQTDTEMISKSCPCYLEDFQCRFNYFFKDDYCILDRFSDFKTVNLKCEPEHRPVTPLNGFTKLARGVCSARVWDSNNAGKKAEVCVSNKYSNSMLFKSMKTLFRYELDYMGHHLPKFEPEYVPIPPDVNRTLPFFYDLLNDYIYSVSNYTISSYQKHRDEIYRTELYLLGFNISSLAIDHYMNLSLILDTNSNLFVLCLRTNYAKLLAQNVTDFEYSHNNLSVSLIKSGQICFYRFYSHIECSKTDLDVQKFVYFDDYHYYALHLKNQTLVIYEGSNISLISTQEAFVKVEQVETFGIIKYNLFFTKSAQLIRVDLRYPTRFDLVSDHDFSDLKFSIHVIYSENPYENFSNGCTFHCNPLIKTEDFCYCKEKEVPQKYVCDGQNSDCLKRYCTGFQCESSECLKNNVMCNRINDCRDRSDEKGCSKKCPDSHHLCEKDCIPKNILCSSAVYEYHGISYLDEVENKNRYRRT